MTLKFGAQKQAPSASSGLSNDELFPQAELVAFVSEARGLPLMGRTYLDDMSQRETRKNKNNLAGTGPSTFRPQSLSLLATFEFTEPRQLMCEN